MNVRQVREHLAVSDSTVRRLVRRGELVAYRVGNQLRFDRAEVEQYVRCEPEESQR